MNQLKKKSIMFNNYCLKLCSDSSCLICLSKFFLPLENTDRDRLQPNDFVDNLKGDVL